MGMESFVEKIILLVITAILTGILVPVIKARIDKNTSDSKKLLEESLKRQVQVMDARATSIKELASLLWQYYSLAKRVAYAGANELKDELQVAFQKYESDGWDVVDKTRSMIGGMRWLLTKDAHIQLVSLYRGWKNELEERCPDPETDEDNLQNWDAYYEWLESEAVNKIDFIVGYLADEFNLPGKDMTYS